MGEVQIARGVCPICGKYFVAKDKRKIFCSKECRLEAQRRRQREKDRKEREARELLSAVCVFCGNTFTPIKNGIKYCSGRCRQRANEKVRQRKKAEERETEKTEKAEKARKLEKMVQQVKQRQSSAVVTPADVAAEAARRQPMTLNEAVAAADAAGLSYGMWQVQRRTQIYQQLRQKREEKK